MNKWMIWGFSHIFGSFLYYFPLAKNEALSSLWIAGLALVGNPGATASPQRNHGGTGLKKEKKTQIYQKKITKWPNVLGSKLPLFPYNRGWSSTQ